MAILNRFRRGSRDAASSKQKLGTEDARQADDSRESVRVLDRSLLLAVLAFVLLGVYVAASFAN